MRVWFPRTTTKRMGGGMVVHLVNPVCLERNIKAIWVIVATLVILVILAYFEILRPDMDLRNNTCVYPVTYKHIHTCTYTCTHTQSNVHTQKSYIFLMAKEKTFKIGSMCFSLWYFMLFLHKIFITYIKYFLAIMWKSLRRGWILRETHFLKRLVLVNQSP